MAKLPIHIHIDRFQSFKEALISSGINGDLSSVMFVWVNISSEGEVLELGDIKGKIPASIVPVVKEWDFIPNILAHIGTYMAMPLEKVNDGVLHRDVLKILAEADASLWIFTGSVVIRQDVLLEKLNSSVNFLRGRGIRNIGVLINEEFSSVQEGIKFYKKLAADLKVSLIAPYYRRENEEETVLINSLMIGNILYAYRNSSVYINYSDYRDFGLRFENDISLIKNILGSLGIAKTGYTIISCPKCGRCQMDLLKINREVDDYLGKLEEEYNKRGIKLEDIGGITVAVMGCNVNGPGEARGADIGIAGGKNGRGTIFKYGEPFETLPEEKVVGKFLEHVKTIIDKKIEKSKIKV